MEVVKLKAATQNYIWGGNRLFKYGKESKDEIIAESWELSCHPAGLSIIDSGIDKGQYLKDVISIDDIGQKCSKFPFFPLLNKLIDAKNDLSIQVHPSDEYALKYENSFGKTEMWYVVDADEGAMLHIGLNKDVSKEEFKQRIENNTLLEILNHIPVKKGDCYFIPSGTLHAIGRGCFIYEIQENSNLTYRVYDYGRVGKDGKPRELHIDKALEVTNLNKVVPQNLKTNPLAVCPYFEVSKTKNEKQIKAPIDSFAFITILQGHGNVNNIPFNQGDSFFIPCNKLALIEGDYDAIKTIVG